jgi:hypothetical protein
VPAQVHHRHASMAQSTHDCANVQTPKPRRDTTARSFIHIGLSSHPNATQPLPFAGFPIRSSRCARNQQGMVIYNLLRHRSIAECLFWTFLRVWLDVLDGKIARGCPADAWWRVPFGVFGAQHGGGFDSLCDTIGSLALLGTTCSSSWTTR